MIKRVIFDLDDTIFITNISALKCIVKGLILNGVLPNKKMIKNLINSFAKYEETFPKYDKKTYIDFINKEYGLNFSYEIYDAINNYFSKSNHTLNKNALKILEYLSSKYEVVALTNYIYSVQHNRLEKSNILKYFKALYTGDDYLKPAKESYMASCNGYKPNECVIIGDDLLKDYLAPQKLGFKVILYDKNQKYTKEEYEKVTDLIKLKDIL